MQSLYKSGKSWVCLPKISNGEAAGRFRRAPASSRPQDSIHRGRSGNMQYHGIELLADHSLLPTKGLDHETARSSHHGSSQLSPTRENASTTLHSSPGRHLSQESNNSLKGLLQFYRRATRKLVKPPWVPCSLAYLFPRYNFSRLRCQASLQVLWGRRHAWGREGQTKRGFRLWRDFSFFTLICIFCMPWSGYFQIKHPQLDDQIWN